MTTLKNTWIPDDTFFPSDQNAVATQVNQNTADVAAAASAVSGKQPADVDLTTIAGLTPADGSVLQRVSGSWAGRTMAQLKSALGLTSGDVGLGSADNTSDATKNAAAAALTNKDLTSGTNTFPTFNQDTTGNAASATSAVPKSTVTTKGDLIVGTGSATVARLAAGANGQVDVDDSTTSTGRAKVYPRPLSFNLPSIGGSTVNSAAQNDTALTAALAAMGNFGELYIPPGTYDFNGNVAYPANGGVRIGGAGRSKTWMRNNHASNPSFILDGTGATGVNAYGPGCELSDLALTATALRTAQVGIDSRLAVTFSIERLHIEGIGIAAQIQRSWAGAYRDIDVLACDVGLIIGSTPADAPLVIDNFNVYDCRRGGWIKGSAACDSLKFINGGFTNSTEHGMVIDSSSRSINFDTVVFEANVGDDVQVGGAAGGPQAVLFSSCTFLAHANKARSVYFQYGDALKLDSCRWFNDGGTTTTAIEQNPATGQGARLVVQNPYMENVTNALAKWDGSYTVAALTDRNTGFNSHGLEAGIQRFGNVAPLVASSAQTLAVARPVYVFTGGSTVTWTLPPIALNTGEVIPIKNRGSAALTVASASGSQIYDTAAQSSISVAAGAAVRLFNDGTYWVAI